MSQFEIGDTLLVRFPNGQYPHLQICGTHFLNYSSGRLTGSISDGVDEMDYEAFKADLPNCKLQTGTIEQIEAALTIYPNPVIYQLNVNLQGFQLNQVALYDDTGQLRHQSDQLNTQQTNLDLQELSNGIYIMKLTIGNQEVTRRVVVH